MDFKFFQKFSYIYIKKPYSQILMVKLSITFTTLCDLYRILNIKNIKKVWEWVYLDVSAKNLFYCFLLFLNVNSWIMNYFIIKNVNISKIRYMVFTTGLLWGLLSLIKPLPKCKILMIWLDPKNMTNLWSRKTNFTYLWMFKWSSLLNIMLFT